MNSMRGLGGLRMLVVLLIVMQAVAVVLAWSLNPLAQRSQAEFALLLSADLLGFAVVSYLVRTSGRGGSPRALMVLAGSVFALVLMFLVLLV